MTADREAETLLSAIQGGDLERVRSLLTRRPTLDEAADEKGVGMLMQALYHRQPEIAETMAAARRARGAALGVEEAASLGEVECVEEILRRDPSARKRRSPDGFTPLHYACFFGRDQVARLLLERGAEVEAEATNPSRVRPLHSAAAAGATAICRDLLERGADPDSRQTGGFTALMSAAANGNEELVRLLLAHGADTSVVSDDGKTAADLARERGQEALLPMLGD